MVHVEQPIKYTAMLVPPTANLNRNTPRCEHWDKRTQGFELMADSAIGERTFKYVCECCIPTTGNTQIFR